LRVASIDCGTNAIRLLIADVTSTGLVDVARRMEIVRLGEGVDRTGLLSPAAIERTRQALLGYAAEIAELGVSRVRMCATSATRDAGNAQDFRDMVRGVLGIDPEVITGEEEAALSFLGAVRGIDAPGPYLVFDLGGGSTEFVTGTTGVEHAISMDIGCVRMTERHLHSDPPTAAEIELATADIVKAVETALTAVPGKQARTLVGLAGTVTTVAALALRLEGYDSERIHYSRIEAADVARVTDELLAMTVAERLALPVMHPGRADVIGAGALIEKIIVELSGHGSVIASEHDILDGIAYGLAEAP
jgi:exopolyphosphatase/guanosine-5'-triphosphate,3'-diphosphate pyrophosphatase